MASSNAENAETSDCDNALICRMHLLVLEYVLTFTASSGSSNVHQWCNKIVTDCLTGTTLYLVILIFIFCADAGIGHSPETHFCRAESICLCTDVLLYTGEYFG